MTRMITLCFIVLSFSGYSQNYINKPKPQVKKELNDYILKNDSLKASLTETDTSIALTVKRPEAFRANFIYRFDKGGKCMSEKVTTYSDTSFTKFLQAALSRKEYEWRKINGNQYISNYTSRMLMELPVDTSNFSFFILRTDWSKSMYDLLRDE